MASRLRAGGYGYGDAKKALLAAYHEKFDACAAKREELAANPKQVEEILARGAARAREIATPTLEAARKAVGLK
jgi:tryptophanyl-tRNA synthetase